ncbi:MAG: complex I subunit 1 family protein [Candidatus Thermoplasmatota archaeon]|jgi:NADH-quinone oxidoreductase subunit H
MASLTNFVDIGLKAIGWDAPHWVDLSIASVIGAVLLFTVVLSIGGLFTFAFRRIFARMGQRRGPNRVGPQGILQFLADGAKLISKEDIRPAKADKLAWTAALYVAVVFTVMAWAAIPWSRDLVFSNVGTGVLLILAMGAIAPLAEIMAGWGSNNKYSLYGGVRAAALDVSYEIPMVFSVAAIVLITGSLSTVDIVEGQSHGSLGMIPFGWFIVPQILGFVIFLITALAKAGLVPTDLAESESELVAGFTTEYSAMRFGMFFVVLFSNVFFVSAMITMLYLGGWSAPFGNELPFLTIIPTPLWFLGKALLMSFVVFWIWITLPRVRVDQYLNVAWKVLLPLSILNFVVTAVLIKSGVL